MFTFSTPCFRYKLVLATKNQNGWPGFNPPYNTRYLAKLVAIQQTPATGGQSTSITSTWSTDRLTGLISQASSGTPANADFPYGATLNNTGGDPSNAGYESWQVTDTQFIHTINNGYFVYTTTVNLSNLYDFDQLDADANALLSSVSIASMPWNSLIVAPGADQSVPLGADFDGFGLQDTLLPQQVAYQGDTLSIPGPTMIPQLLAAAWAIYAPGAVSDQNYFPNGYSKLISYIAMAGNYCEKTFLLDYNQDVLNQTCLSGVGSCASPFKVNPPTITPGENAYVLIVPNCQCGS